MRIRSALSVLWLVACGSNAETTRPPSSPTSQVPRYEDPSVGTISGEGTCASPFVAFVGSSPPLHGELPTDGESAVRSDCGGDGSQHVFVFPLATEESDRRGYEFVIESEDATSIAVYSACDEAPIACTSLSHGHGTLTTVLGGGDYRFVVEGTGGYVLRSRAARYATDPIDGILSLALHPTSVGEPAPSLTVRYDEAQSMYLAERSADPSAHAPVSVMSLQEILNLLDRHRETFSAPVETGNFLAVNAGHLAIERRDPPEIPHDEEQIERLQHFSDQWALLGDIADASARENRRASTYRGIRQSMENLNTVCEDAGSERCANHRAWVAAYNEVAERFRALVETAFAEDR